MPTDPQPMPSTAVTIGNFDGVHAGHAALVQAAREAAGPEGRVVVLAFDPHPASVLRPGAEPPRLTTFEHRAELLTRFGADEIIQLEPSKDLLEQEPEAFIRGVVEQHRPAGIIEGPDFHFGKGRAGTPETLRRLAESFGFEAITVEPVQIGLRDQSVVTASSSIARWLLENGRVRDAALVLGRPYALTGTVTQGDRRGRTIGFPTANLESATMVPGPGVYAAIATCEIGSYVAAVNIGTRPTFEGTALRVEAHLLETEDYRSASEDQATPTNDGWTPLPGLSEYGWALELELISRVRDEIEFGSVDELVSQLHRDIQHVRDRIGPVGPDRHSHLETRHA